MWLKHEASRGNAAAQVKRTPYLREPVGHGRPGHQDLSDLRGLKQPSVSLAYSTGFLVQWGLAGALLSLSLGAQADRGFSTHASKTIAAGTRHGVSQAGS